MPTSNSSRTKGPIICGPEHLKDLVALYAAKEVEGANPNELSSLVGAIGEVWTVIHKEMVLAPPGVSDIDGWVGDDRVQVKTIGPNRSSSAFTVTRHADRLMYLWMRDARGTIDVIYDGPIKPVIEAVKGRARKHHDGQMGRYQFDAWTMMDLPDADRNLAKILRERFRARERER